MPGNEYYGSRYQLMARAQLGDPIFGALAGLVAGPLINLFKKKAVPAVAKLAGSGIARAIPTLTGRVLPALGTTATLTSTAIAVRAAIPAIAGTMPVGLAAKIGSKALPVLAGGAALAAGASMFTGGRRRIRRMNMLNPRALNRAVRRLSGFHTFAVSTESTLRKLAPRSTRCAPRKPKCR